MERGRSTSTAGRSTWRLAVAALAVAVVSSACRPNIPPAQAAGRCNVGIVGDSLTVGSLPYWEEAFASRGCTLTLVNARSGRPTGEGVRVIELMALTGQLPDVLVVALGTNDPFDPRDFAPKVARVMAVVGDRPVLWVNIDKPIVEYTLNLTLNLALIRYDNLWVYDWNGFVDAFPQLRLVDQVHLTEGGYALRAALIAREVSGR